MSKFVQVEELLNGHSMLVNIESIATVDMNSNHVETTNGQGFDLDDKSMEKIFYYIKPAQPSPTTKEGEV